MDLWTPTSEQKREEEKFITSHYACSLTAVLFHLVICTVVLVEKSLLSSVDCWCLTTDVWHSSEANLLELRFTESIANNTKILRWKKGIESPYFVYLARILGWVVGRSSADSIHDHGSKVDSELAWFCSLQGPLRSRVASYVNLKFFFLRECEFEVVFVILGAWRVEKDYSY